jgi:hypothetical protein
MDTLALVSGPTPVQTYAQAQNSKFQTEIDVYVDIPTRFSDLLAQRPNFMAIFQELADEIVSRYPFKSYQEMTKHMVGMGGDTYGSLLDTDINCTMQRLLDGEWEFEIMGDFDPILVNPVRVYQDPHRTDGGTSRFVAWDGQHTAILLYIVATLGYGADPKDVKIPLSIYPGSDRAAIRKQFLYYNSGIGSKKLDAIDLFMQYVYGYTNDGSRESMNQRCYTVQKYAEAFGLFMTHEKFGNDNRAGAISRLSEIMNLNYDVEIFEKVFYYHSVAANLHSSPVYALEIDNLAHYFKACHEQGIIVTHAYIDHMASILDGVTNNTWNVGSKKHNKVINAYKNWFTKAQAKGAFEKGEKPRCNQTEVGPVWLAQVFAHASKNTMSVPKFTQNLKFAVADLV